MSSSKGDSRYVPEYDTPQEPDIRSSSDEEDAGSTLPPLNPYQKWVWDNQDELEDLYTILITHGSGYFGRAFLQFCTLGDFASYVHTHTQP